MSKGAADKALQAALQHHQAGRLDQAEEHYRRVLRLQPNNVTAIHNLALVAYHRGRDDQSLNLLTRTLALRPDYADAHANMGVVLRRLGRPAEAVAHSEKALALAPGNPRWLHNLGNALKDLRRMDEAVARYRQALALAPDFPDALASLAFALLEMKAPDEAAALCERALALQPNHVDALKVLGNVRQQQHRLDEARALYERAMALRPDWEALHNLGVLSRKQGRLAEAEQQLAKALEMSGGQPSVFNSYSILLREESRFAESLAALDKAIAGAPDYHEARVGRAGILLMHGHFQRGWEEYEARRPLAHPGLRLPGLEWDGSDPAGRTIMLYCEQGLGDTIQFARYALLLAARGAKVLLAVQPHLARLMRSLPGDITVVPDGAPMPRFDFHLPLLSCPRLFATRPETIPAPVPYLSAEPERVALWRERLPQEGKRIGVVWQGNPQGAVDEGRSIPLRHFAPLAALPGVRLISLQKNHGLDQLGALPAGQAPLLLPEEFDGGPDAFVDSAAVMMSLDLVVTSDTSIAHLAGALGRPVWIGLKHVPEWRWGLAGEHCPWYPTARLFRQTSPGDWDGVFARMAEALKH